MIATKRGNLLVKILERIERPVDGRESEVGDLVQFTKWPENRTAHIVGTDLGAAGRPHVFLDPLGEQRERVFIDGTPLASLANAGDHLLATERLGGPAALDHQEGGRFQCGEATTADTTRAPAPDRRATVGLPAVDNAAVGGLAERTAHDPGPPFRFTGPMKAPVDFWLLASGAVDTPVGNRPKSVGNLLNNLWTTYMGVTTRCCVPDSRATPRVEQA